MLKNKTILVAPLNWGLGHATRCIPVIEALIKNGYKIIVASDGAALSLLRKEFTQLETIELPSYNITYPKKGSHFRWKIFLKLPHIRKTIVSEKRLVKKLVSEGKIDGIISDNRFGVRSKKIPSAFITHQLNVLTGITTAATSKIHQKVIKKFDECWIPDIAGTNNLSGNLGHLESTDLNVKYMGILSRMKKKIVPNKYNLMVLISGPEPQRTLLEEIIITELKDYDSPVLMVRGVIEAKQKIKNFGAIKTINFMQTVELEQAINESKVIVCRSGYTTIMDLSVLEKKAFFIPTPGQFEQEYLAENLQKKGIAPSCSQANFTSEKIKETVFYDGFKNLDSTVDFSNLFSLFQRERKL